MNNVTNFQLLKRLSLSFSPKTDFKLTVLFLNLDLADLINFIT
jgi:hypothetical protein